MRGPALPCPRCGGPLHRAPAGRADDWACASCGGHAVRASRLRRGLPAGVAEGIAAALDGGGRRGELRCPLCAARLFGAAVAGPRGTLHLDACDRCRLLWFDGGEHAAAAGRGPAPPPRASDGARPSVLSYAPPADVRPLLEVEPLPPTGDLDALDALSMVLDVPVPGEDGSPRRPVLAPLLAAAILATGLAALLTGVETWIRDFGFHPGRPFRHGGLDALTAPLLHGDLLPLLANAWMLLLLGSRVEEVLRALPTLGLFLAATLAGWVAVVAGGGWTVASGAYGGIAGLAAWYALEFPHARIRTVDLIYMAGLSLSWTARTWAVAWFAWVFLLALAGGGGMPAALAAVGGGLAGATIWAAGRYGWPDRGLLPAGAAGGERSPGGPRCA